MTRPAHHDDPYDIVWELDQLWDIDEWWDMDCYYGAIESTYCSCTVCRVAAYFTEGDVQHTGHDLLRFPLPLHPELGSSP